MNIWFPNLQAEEVKEEKPRGYLSGFHAGLKQQRRNHNYTKNRPEYQAYQEGYKDGKKKFIEDYIKRMDESPD
jgi:hypothetical protein